MFSYRDLPWPGMTEPAEGYRQLLGLCSHEHFHSWNVKRIKPAAFTPYRLDRPCHTRLLWWFEGVTSYYDDLALVRSGVISRKDYLDTIAKTFSRVLGGAGRKRQSVSESSFDAWTRFYRQDENAANAIVSYYAKGMMIALALDLKLRLHKPTLSLDVMLRRLWQRHPGDADDPGVREEEPFELAGELGGTELMTWLARAVDGTDDLPLAALLGEFGIDWQAAPETPAGWLGVTTETVQELVRLRRCDDGGAAMAAGLSAGDLLVALDGVRLRAGTLAERLKRHAPGDRVRIDAFRDDRLMSFEVILQAAPAVKISLAAIDAVSPEVATRRDGWLGGAAPA